MTEVDELTGTEGGIWRVWTQGSSYVIDLEQMTVTRHPGPNSSPTINDTTRPIRSLTTCQVGKSGYWTMHADGGVLDEIDLYWQLTTEIRKIERIDEANQLSIQEIARELEVGLGQALVAVIVNRDTSTLTRWASGADHPPAAEERILRDTLHVFEVVARADSPEVARAWFLGMNPDLDDRTPAKTIAEGGAREVMAAARSFTAGK